MSGRAGLRRRDVVEASIWTTSPRGVSIALVAKQTTVTVADELDGFWSAKEVTFSLDGQSWAIDLSAKNRSALEKTLKPASPKPLNRAQPPGSGLPQIRSSRPPPGFG